MDKKLTRKKGYGAALLMVFVASTVLIGASLQMMAVPVTSAYLGKASRDNLAARQVAEIGFNAALADIQSKLNSATTVNTSYRFPTTLTTDVSIPNDPENPTAGSTVLGNYYATVTLARGYSYILSVVATSGGATYNKSQLFLMTDVPTPPPAGPFTCAVEGAALETSILSNGLTSITDADLIAYAQNDCMIKNVAAPTLVAPVASTNLVDCNTAVTNIYGGSGIINFNNINNKCVADISAASNYSNIRVSALNDAILNLKYSGSQTIDIATLTNAKFDGSFTSVGKTFHLNSLNGAYIDGSSTYSGTFTSVQRDGNSFRFYIAAPCTSSSIVQSGSGSYGYGYSSSSYVEFYPFGTSTLTLTPCGGGSGGASYTGNGIDPSSTTEGNDTVHIGSCTNCYLDLLNGQDTLVIPGDVDGDVLIQSGCLGGTCSTTDHDSLYFNHFEWTSDGYAEINMDNGNDAIYFQSNNGGEFYTGSGNDVIACASVFGGTCTTNDGAAVMDGEAGNDIISMNGSVSGNSEVLGGTGNNIVYVKTAADTIIRGNSSSGTPIPSLVIIGGNVSGSSVIRAWGTGSVVLIKTGSTTVAPVGFTRTLYY